MSEEILLGGALDRIARIQVLERGAQGRAVGDLDVLPAAVLLGQRLLGGLALGAGAAIDQIAAVGIHLDHPAVLGQHLQPRVVDIARMVKHRTRAAVREHDRHWRQCDQLVEHRIGGMRLIDHDAQRLRLLHQLLAGRAQALPLRPLGVGGRVGELVVEKMHGTHQAQALRVIEAQQRGVGHQRAGVFHADVHHALASGLDARGIGGRGGEGEALRLRGQQRVDLQQALQTGIAIIQMRGRTAIALRGVDRPEAAIQRAFDHARVVHLRQPVASMRLQHVEVGALQVGRRIQMRIQRDQALLQRRGARQFGLGKLQRVGRQRGGEQQRDRQRQRVQVHAISQPGGGHRIITACGTRTARATAHAMRTLRL
ncbi:hypothetical protein LMG19144_03996 [Xanthomonas arboricola pv. fragariae]|nr:hypothetical protein LMG19144_03996 [Xanthomonas arboricola pv. fragariae]